jgi:hypothetical protein
MDDADSPRGFVNYGDRRRMIRSLNTAAWLVKTGIPKRVPLPDPSQRVVFEDRCHSAAAWLRSLILWVALPNPGTHRDLSDASCRMSFILITGRYDDFPVPSVEKPTGRQRARGVLSVLRVVAAGAIPALVLVVARPLGVTLDGPAGAAATTFCIAWAAVTYLQLIDPLFGQRLSTMRDLMGTVRGGMGSAGTSESAAK